MPTHSLIVVVVVVTVVVAAAVVVVAAAVAVVVVVVVVYSVDNQLRYAKTQLDRLKKTNVFNTTFHIWYVERFTLSDTCAQGDKNIYVIGCIAHAGWCGCVFCTWSKRNLYVVGTADILVQSTISVWDVCQIFRSVYIAC